MKSESESLGFWMPAVIAGNGHFGRLGTLSALGIDHPQLVRSLCKPQIDARSEIFVGQVPGPSGEVLILDKAEVTRIRSPSMLWAETEMSKNRIWKYYVNY